MKEDSRLGVFFMITTIQEIVGLVSEATTIVMLIKTGFSVEGLILLLLKVVVNLTLFLSTFLQYLGVTVFLLQIRGLNLSQTLSAPLKQVLPLALYALSPLLQLGTYLGFTVSWMGGASNGEVCTCIYVFLPT